MNTSEDTIDTLSKDLKTLQKTLSGFLSSAPDPKHTGYLALSTKGLNQLEENMRNVSKALSLGASKIENDSVVYQELLSLFRQILEEDVVLRKRFHIGEEYEFISKQLSAMIAEIEQKRVQLEQVLAARLPKERKQARDESLIYVYLYNDHGQKLKSWEHMLLSETVWQFSVNRPVYLKRDYIERMIRSRENPINHAYVVAVIKNHDIYEQEDKTFGVDPLDQPLVRVREGSISLENIVEFKHYNKVYKLLPTGQLQEKK